MKKFSILLFFLALFLVMSQIAFAGGKSVEAEGISGVSRADAIRSAQRAAVEQSVGVFIKSETETRNYVIQKDKILSRTKGYITGFDIVKDTKKDGLYQVTIKADVSLDKIKDDLLAMKILLDSMARPKLVILIQEDYLDMKKPGMKIAETELTSLMAQKGFELVDKAQLEKTKELDKARQALAGDLKAASSLGLEFGAQYVVIGKAVAQDVGEAFAGTGLRSIQASIQVKVIQSQSALILGSVVKNGVTANVSPLTGATLALKEAAKKAVDEYLVDAITNSFQDYLNNGTPLQLNVGGVKTFHQYKMIARAIESIDSVASSKKQGWNKAGGMLVLDLRFKGTSEELAERLDGIKIDKSTIEVTDFAPDRVNGQFRSK